MDANATMTEWVARLRGLSRDALKTVAVEAAPLVEKAVRDTARAGNAPDGEAWRAKKTGGAPMVNAASHITARAIGATVRVFLVGADVFHHFAVRGEVRRQVIPEGLAIPSGVLAALDEAKRRAFARLMGAR